MNERLQQKLGILANAAKYDVSCASSGSSHGARAGGFGSTFPAGICHSYTEDGRCVSLLKILFTNHCVYDCAYCVNRRSNDLPRAAFTVAEVVELTLNFYRRNYIEGLFLSSGVVRNPDFTMERLVRVARELRQVHKYYGYIHLKSIPGCSPELVRQAGLYADRLSVNIELPSENSLVRLAPEKNYAGVLEPMNQIRDYIVQHKEERRRSRHALTYAPAGQSTQLIVGASPEADRHILFLADKLYHEKRLKRVYYSGYLPVPGADNRLPALVKPPLVRENRLYQADWLLRFYQFTVDEIVNDQYPDLEQDIDPKLAYALRNPHLFPLDVNKAPYEMLLRIPGVGVRSAQLIVSARKHGHVGFHQLKKIGVVMKRAQYFIYCTELPPSLRGVNPATIRRNILSPARSAAREGHVQLSLF